MTAPCLLALDTASDTLVVALRTPAGRWLRELPGGAAASATLLPAVAALVAEAGIGLPALQAVAFGAGPGAVTGLRTACAAAQGLALGLGCPVLPLDNLALLAEDAATAEPALGDGQPLWVAVDARMDEIYAAAYVAASAAAADAAGQAHPAHLPAAAPAGGRWRAARPPALYTLAALQQLWTEAPPARVVGNAVTAFADRLPLAAARCWPQPVDRAAALLRLAEAAWAAGAGTEAAQALPLYLRDKVAQTTAERAARQLVSSASAPPAQPIPASAAACTPTAQVPPGGGA